MTINYSLRHFANIFEQNADLLPDNPAAICGDSTLSWKEYDQEAAKVAQFLSDNGVGEDSKVGLYLHNSNQYLVAHYAAFKVMGVPINVNYRYQANELPRTCAGIQTGHHELPRSSGPSRRVW